MPCEFSNIVITPESLVMESCEIIYSNWGSISWAIAWFAGGCVAGIVIKSLLDRWNKGG